MLEVYGKLAINAQDEYERIIPDFPVSTQNDLSPLVVSQVIFPFTRKIAPKSLRSLYPYKRSGVVELLKFDTMQLVKLNQGKNNHRE